MQHQAEPEGRRLHGPWLYVAEVMHRVSNDYAIAIASASLKAARSVHPETRAALLELAQRLLASAEAHRLIQSPIGDGKVDLVAHISGLCRAFAAGRAHAALITLQVNGPAAVQVDGDRAWRIGLILAELMTNAVKHTPLTQGETGGIDVWLSSDGESLVCRVANSGEFAAKVARANRGTYLVDSMAEEISGTMERRFSARGVAVTLTCPLVEKRDAIDGSFAPHERLSPVLPMSAI